MRDEQIKIELAPDYQTLEKYLDLVSKNKMTWFNLQLLKIPDFDNNFCELIENYKLISHLSNIFYFAGDFVCRIESVNKGEYLKRNQQGKEYIEQYNQLIHTIYNHTPKSIFLKHVNNEFGMTITNPDLIYDILKAISTIPKPTHDDTLVKGEPDKDTFRRRFIKHTKKLYQYLHDFEKCRLNEAAEFISKLLTILNYKHKPDNKALKQKFGENIPEKLSNSEMLEIFEAYIFGVYSKKE